MSNVAGRPSGLRTRAGTAATLAGLVLTLAAWIIASPHGAPPDATFHLVSMACADGYDGTICFDPQTSEFPQAAFVPVALEKASCMIDRAATGACAEELFAADTTDLSRGFGNLNGTRPNLYYWVGRRVLLPDLDAWVFLVRSLNALSVVGLLVAVHRTAPPSIRQAHVGAWLLTSVPLVLFLTTSVNSSAWGLVGAAAFWAGLATALTAGGGSRRGAGAALAIIGAAMALGSRSEAVVMLAVTTLAITIWSWPAIRAGWGRMTSSSRRGATAGIAVFLVAAATLVPRLPAFDIFLNDITDDVIAGATRFSERDLGSPVLWSIAEGWQFITGVFGHRWGLGWLETEIPTGVIASMLFVLAGFLFAGLGRLSRRRAASILIVFAVMMSLPMASLLGAGGFTIGEVLQPRHFLPVLHLLIGLVLLRDRPQDRLAISRGQLVTAGLFLGFAHSLALFTNLSRYTRGQRLFHFEFGLTDGAQWWWSWAPIGPTGVWIVGSVAFLAAAAGGLSLFRAEAPIVEPDGGPRSG